MLTTYTWFDMKVHVHKQREAYFDQVIGDSNVCTESSKGDEKVMTR